MVKIGHFWYFLFKVRQKRGVQPLYHHHVQVAVNSVNDKPITIYSDDIDILCLLIHHSVQLSDTRDIYLINIRRKKSTKQRECFNIKDINNNLDQFVIQYLPIYKFGKTAIFEKIHDSNHLKNLATEFYNNNKLSEDIGNTATRIFECLFSSTGSKIKKEKI